jgi:hypothetical protein
VFSGFFLHIKCRYLQQMKHLFLLLLLVVAANSYGQLTVDTTRATITVKEKAASGVKTLTIYRSFVQGIGNRNQAIYQPGADELGDETETLQLTFAEEATHIKKMLDAATAKKQINLSSFSINMLPYKDLTRKLTEIYTSSTDWADYLKKNADNLKKTTELFDGSEYTEVHFYAKMAKYVLDKSDFYAQLNELFKPYGYTVSSINFPEEHQQILSTDRLMLLGKNGNLFIPVPDYSLTLTKLKK